MKTGKSGKFLMSLLIAIMTVLSFHTASAHAAPDAIKPSECSTHIFTVYDETVGIGDIGHSRFYCGSINNGVPIEFSDADLEIAVDNPHMLHAYANPSLNSVDFEGLEKGDAEVTIYWKNKPEGTKYTFLLVQVK
ncbi:hypothetical protein OZL92_18455 [Bacillus sonorensis]|uniref:Secreted protein n=2 Tax=Bacillus sonorensis TaxID=119858 RepID=M5P8H6_9BACI|nr:MULTISPECIES: hypothetical protein [Bacteria]TWK84343.1 hypothetical protein CHCC20335_4411 [Bacillus paralicheniformis]ASB89040.1 hypothetical protein S101395_02533 [Bacillus sonorensis]EME75734.1 hypothetical protein BSONL12_05448 [Bacillus sonorensis L12]MCZ0075171.1 hypothetical protein [Bacillus sonorensis]MCZ0093311.1 hypothetical protein [Bacillus sonorensis]